MARKTEAENQMVPKWQVRRGDMILAYGPESTMPPAQERKQKRQDGYDIYIDGKLSMK